MAGSGKTYTSMTEQQQRLFLFDAASAADGVRFKGGLMINQEGNEYTMQRICQDLQGVPDGKLPEVKKHLESGNWFPNYLPRASLNLDNDGHLVDINFERSRFNWNRNAQDSFRQKCPYTPSERAKEIFEDRPWTRGD